MCHPALVSLRLCNSSALKGYSDGKGSSFDEGNIGLRTYKQTSKFTASPKFAFSPPEQASEVHVHLGLLLESYKFSATVMSSLKYLIDGQAARSTFTFRSWSLQDLTADIDLGGSVMESCRATWDQARPQLLYQHVHQHGSSNTLVHSHGSMSTLMVIAWHGPGSHGFHGNYPLAR